MNGSISPKLLAAMLAAPQARLTIAERFLESGELPQAANHDDGPLLYSVAQAARRMNCSRSTVWRALRARGIKKVELYPGCERIRRADVDALAGVAP